MKASGSSQNTSTLVEVMPSFSGLSQPLLAGSPTKNGAPAISNPATDPRLHNTEAPRARWYHATAAGASLTASISDIRSRSFPFSSLDSFSILTALDINLVYCKENQARKLEFRTLKTEQHSSPNKLL
ncbi:MAG: hypothetical protein E6H10_17805 [Bacteroidetes bacterium]|nr:MAG: hypothetical protein E6H10_17805 [Bacteroidota bacterium]